MLFATKNRREYKVSRIIEELDDEFARPLLPKLHNTSCSWSEIDLKGENDGAMPNRSEIMSLGSVAVRVEGKHRIEKGKKRVKKFVNTIGKTMASHLTDICMLQASGYGCQFALPAPVLSVGVFVFAF